MGRYLGYFVVGAGALLSIFALTQEGWGAMPFVGFSLGFALVAWVVLIRPQVSAHMNGLLLRNMVRDTFLPWGSIKSCRVAQTLQIGTRDKVYHGLGVSKSARVAKKQWRHRTLQPPLGPHTGMTPPKYAPASMTEEQPEVSAARQELLVKDQFVHTEQRIETLAMQGAAATADHAPRVAWDLPAVVALVIAGVSLLTAIVS